MSWGTIPVKLIKLLIAGALFWGALLSVFLIYGACRAIAFSKEAVEALIILSLCIAHPGIIAVILIGFRQGMDKHVYKLMTENENFIRTRKKYLSRWIRSLVLSVCLPFSILLFLAHRILGFPGWLLIFLAILSYPVAGWYMMNVLSSEMDQYQNESHG